MVNLSETNVQHGSTEQFRFVRHIAIFGRTFQDCHRPISEISSRKSISGKRGLLGLVYLHFLIVRSDFIKICFVNREQTSCEIKLFASYSHVMIVFQLLFVAELAWLDSYLPSLV